MAYHTHQPGDHAAMEEEMANVTKADMMVAQDAFMRAFDAMVKADREWEATGSEAANFNQAQTRKAFKKASARCEAMRRQMAQQVAA